MLIGCGWFTVAQANTNINTDSNRITRIKAFPDTIAVVAGKELDYRISTDQAFENVYDTYSIDASTPLPSWLSFNRPHLDTLKFSGIAGRDIGSTLIKVIGQTGATQEEKILFITVQSAPVIDLNGSEQGRRHMDFLEEKGGDSVNVTRPDVAITDQDGTIITEAIISLSGVEDYNSNEEYLLVSDLGRAAADVAGITGLDYIPSSGNIELKGSASLADYEAVLKEILYVNVSEALSSENNPRTIIFYAIDKDGNKSNPSLTDIYLVPENDPPIIDINGGDEGNSTDGSPDFINTFTEDQPQPAIVTDTDVVMEDVDFDGVGQFTVSILNRLDDTPTKQHESLKIIGMLPAGFSFGYDINQQDLIITGEGSLEDFATAIEQVGYYNTDQDPDNTPRRISIIFSDLAGGTDQAFAQINVIPVNDPPDAMDSTIYVAEGRKGNRMKLDYPTDIDNDWDELTITVSGLPTLGTVMRADGTPVAVGETLDSLAFAELRYDSPDNYDNSDPGDFTYTTSDLEPLSKLSTIDIIINSAPEAADTTIVTDEDVAYVLLKTVFSENYTDVEGDTLTSIIITTLPNNSTLMLDTVRLQAGDTIGINASDSLELRFIPAANMFGNPFTTFNFQVTDAVGLASEPHQVTVIVNPVNDPPVVDTVLVAGEENDILFFTADQFTSQFSDIDGDTLVNINIVSLPANGMLLLDGEPVAVGDTIPVEKINQLAFEPETNFDGVTEFLWNGYDGTAYAEQPAPVIITIGENNLLRARDSEELVDEDMLFLESSLVPNVINPTGHAIIFDTVPVANVQHGVLILNVDGTYRYTPDEGFVGEDAFTFRVCNQDDPPECAEATVTITVRRRSSIVIFKGFSPDGDGRNDVWRIPNIEEYPNNTVQIFNRWGNRVFEATGYNNTDKAWGGGGTGLTESNVPDGTYYYLIDLGPEGLQEKPLSGYLIVNR